ncbi:MAG: phosphoglycolate phosphatase [Candidatus Poriferisodalaceae bacterium]|jgi:phosphoglycolate phosphatase
MALEAVLFDKDGTLVDFHLTWDVAVGNALRHAAQDTVALSGAADAVHYDLVQNTVLSSSPFIAESNETVLALLAPFVDIKAYVEVLGPAAVSHAAAAPGVDGFLAQLGHAGIKLAVVTNDDVAPAEQQLAALGWTDRFAAVIGADSVTRAKPDPEMVFAALNQLGGIDTASAVMIGDSSHDLVAANAAGVTSVLVTNGSVADAAMAVLADLVVASVAELDHALASIGLPL